MHLKHVAQLCHEANRLYCASINEAAGTWWAASDLQRESCINGVWIAVNDPEITPEMLHENWCIYKRAEGWVYDKVKSERNKTHPQLIPWDQLPQAQRNKDILFLGIVRLCQSIGEVVR